MRSSQLRFTVFVLLLSFLLTSSFSLAQDEEISQKFYLEPQCFVHLNVKLLKYDVYSFPKGEKKSLFFAPELGNLIIDTEQGKVFEATKFKLDNNGMSCTVTYKELVPVEGGSASLVTGRNKWKLKAEWPENVFLVTIPFKPNPKAVARTKARIKAEQAKEKEIKKEAKAESKKKSAAVKKASQAKKKATEKKKQAVIKKARPVGKKVLVKSDLTVLGEGLLWSRGKNGKELKPPTVRKIKVPSIKTKGLKTLGVSYHFEMKSKALKAPVSISFPIPAELKKTPEKLVFLKQSDGKEEIVFPSYIDKVQGRATVLCRSFSTYTPGFWDVDHAIAIVGGDLTLKEGCEETPDTVYFDMSCQATIGGHKANFVYETYGVGPFQLFMPLPTPYFGTYTFHRLFASSDNFFYSMNPLYKTLNIDGKSKKYHIILMMIPTTTQIKGKIVDAEGNPLAGIKIELDGSEGLFYNTTSKADGSFYIEFIGLSDPHNKPTETFTYTLENPEDENLSCSRIEGTVTMTAGKTCNENLVYQHQGFVAGVVEDTERNFIEGAKVTVLTKNAKIFTTHTDKNGYYVFAEVPVGNVNVSTMCPDGGGYQAQDVEVECSNDEPSTDFTNFVLDCSDGLTFSISHSGALESDGKYLAHKANTTQEFTLFLPKGKNEASVDVVYSVEHNLTAKKGNRLEFTPNASHFNLDAVVRWTVRKTVNRRNVVEYGFQRETIERESKKLSVGMAENGEHFDTIDTVYGALIDPVLCSPGTVYILEKNLPFTKDYKKENNMALNAGAIPGAESIRGSKSSFRTSLTIECKNCNIKK